MLANLLHVAGVNHIVTIDLHASQMQGFFKCPVDNLHAEPLIARWIRHNVEDWKQAVCVSKNAGGTKRVTSLADALKLNFGMVTTDRRRNGNMSASIILPSKPVYSSPLAQNGYDHDDLNTTSQSTTTSSVEATELVDAAMDADVVVASSPRLSEQSASGTTDSSAPRRPSPLHRSATTPTPSSPRLVGDDDDADSLYTDERAREVIHGRLVHGHIVPDDYPSPETQSMSNSMILDRPEDDPLELSRTGSFFTGDGHALGGTGDAGPSSDEEDNEQERETEQMITLVGDVKGRTVFIVDDMIDKCGSWIAAAETVKKRGGAKRVYIIATHGLFGGDSLEELEACDCIDKIVVTNSFPIDAQKVRQSKKLVVLELAGLLSEAIRRNHYGESISALFQHASD